MTLPVKNVPLAECFNSDKENAAILHTFSKASCY
jgi:hypothetical protein